MFVYICSAILMMAPSAVALVIPHAPTEGAVRLGPHENYDSCCFGPTLKPQTLRTAVMNIVEQSDHGATLLNNTLLETADVVLRAFGVLTKKLQPMSSMAFVGGFVGNLLRTLDESTSSMEQLLMKNQQTITENAQRLDIAGEKYAGNMSIAGVKVQSLISNAKGEDADAKQARESNVVVHSGGENTGLAVLVQSIFGSVKHALVTPRDLCSEANHSVQASTQNLVVFQKQWLAMSSSMLRVLHGWPDAVTSTFEQMNNAIGSTISPSFFPDRLQLLVAESLVPMRQAVETAVKHASAAHAQVSDAFAAIETHGFEEIKDHLTSLHRQADSACNILSSKAKCVDRPC